mgnify:CR=1 FL=1
MKYDNDKAPLALIPSETLTQIAHVFGFGAKKYAVNNWRKDADSTEWSRTYSSIQRHLNSFWQGEDIDPDSGLSHLAHAATQIMILMIQQEEGKNMDDRYNKNESKRSRKNNQRV